MKQVLCDTNVFILLFKGDKNVLAELKDIGDKNVYMPSIVLMELFRGMNNKEALHRMKKATDSYNILHLNEDVSILAVELIRQFKLSHDLKIPDALIGALSIISGLELFTYNKKDFIYMPSIKLYSLKD